MVNTSVGIVVEFSPEFVYPRLYLYSAKSNDHRIELNELLTTKAPHLVFPTEKTHLFLTQMVQNVLACKKTESKKYPEDISMENVISKYANALRNEMSEVFRGDLSL